jgi:small subunit ribosomal protein S20
MVKYSMLTKSQEVKSLPNIKSSIKRAKVSKAKTLKNVARKSALKTTVKKCKEAVTKNENASESFRNAVISLDKAAAKKLIHKNTAARRKSKLAKSLKALSASE